MSTVNGEAYCSKMAQTFHMVAASEATTKVPAFGGSADAQGGLVDEACVCSMAAAADNPCQQPPGL